ncbi:Pentraxin fusion protein [Acipenser ruthenus]|uniref:Pentraxin fusion protein n=1 Tax=Acipenser ruthenus TaxID=7906 RepID=A0A444TW14_ACIRT|nr:Pentraxin fusion protein [Acipenser ruthenus]
MPKLLPGFSYVCVQLTQLSENEKLNEDIVHIYSKESCTYTNTDSPSWWRVDLKDTYEISTVIITNRKDCCHERLQGAEIYIGDSPDASKNASIYSKESCTYTNTDSPSWWRVDLKDTYEISTVIITNRKDCCHERLQGAEIRIGDSPDVSKNARCGVVTDTTPGSVHTFCCDGLVGRYVTIMIPGRKENLTLCEVEVYGVKTDCGEPPV